MKIAPPLRKMPADFLQSFVLRSLAGLGTLVNERETTPQDH
jgi:hypothetical protein